MVAKSDYYSNYLKNSFFQILATGIGFLSLFIVVPFLSENKVLYGIYSVCISLIIFFNYADFGFITACQKYVGEYYAKNDLMEEIKIVGFTSFLLILFVVIVGFFLLPIAISPRILIEGIRQSDEGIASMLIFILIFSAPFIAVKRICNVIFSSRIEQYKFQAFSFLGHVIKLLSILVFFTNSHYMLVEYFLFIQIVDIITTILLIVYIFQNYHYEKELLINSFHFDIAIWRLVRGLVGASIFTTISWILYYELDLIVLAKISSPEQLAIYSAAFTFLTLVRNYFSVIYSSFSPRFNHYVGLNDKNGIKLFYIKNIKVLLPIVFFPLLLFVLLGYPLMLSWIGYDYEESVLLAKILVGGNFLAFISYPSTQYIIATNRIKNLMMSSALLPIVFYGGIACAFGSWGIISFAIFKSIGQILTAVYRFIICLKKMNISCLSIVIDLCKNYYIPIVFICVFSFIVLKFMIVQKSAEYLAWNIMLLCIFFFIVVGITIIASTSFRLFAVSLLCKFRKNS